MNKDRAYYAAIDLPALAARIPVDRAARLRSDELGDVIKAVLARCRTETVTGDDLRSLLGEPDAVSSSPNGEVWGYDWIGWHGPNQYFSSTPFVLQGGRVVGIERDGQVLAL